MNKFVAFGAAAFALLPLAASAQVMPEGNALAVSIGATFDSVEEGSTGSVGGFANLDSLAIGVATGASAAVANATAATGLGLTGSNANAGASNNNMSVLNSTVEVNGGGFESSVLIEPVQPGIFFPPFLQ